MVFDAGSGAASKETNSLTWSHTCTGTDLILVVSAGSNGAGGPGEVVTGITYGGAALTFLRADRDTANGADHELWYLIAPATGANNVIITWAAAPSFSTGGAQSFTGADQTTQPDSQGGAAGTTDPITSNITTVAADVMLCDGLHAWIGSSTGGQGAGQTQAWAATMADGDGAGSYKAAGPAGANSMAYTHGGSACAHSVMGIKPAATGVSLNIAPATDTLLGIGSAPAVAATEHHFTKPPGMALAVSVFAPLVGHQNNRSIAPLATALLLSTTLPGVVLTAHHAATPSAAAASLGGFVPPVALTAHHAVNPSVATLITGGSAPLVAHQDNRLLAVTAAALTVNATAPAVARTGHHTATPAAAGTVLSGTVPQLALTANRSLSPAAGVLAISGGIPLVAVGGGQFVVVPFGPGETYLTLSAALAAKASGQPGAISPVADNVNLVFEATSAFADTTPATLRHIDYWTDATHTVTLRAAVGARHDGTPGTGYRLTATGNTTVGAVLLDVNGPIHAAVQGIEVDGLGSTGGGSVAACIATSKDVTFNEAPPVFSIEGCLIHSSDGEGILPAAGTNSTFNADITVANCVISDNAGFGLLMPNSSAAINMARVVGCTFAYNGQAVSTLGMGLETEAVDCLFANNTNDIFFGLFSAASDWNTNTGTYAPGANSQTGVAVAFTNALGGDYSLTPGDYAAMTAKPSAATVAAAVAGWPGTFDATVDVKATPRIEPRTPGAYAGGPVAVLPPGAVMSTGSTAPASDRTRHVLTTPGVANSTILSTPPGVARTYRVYPQALSMGLTGQTPSVVSGTSRTVTPAHFGLQLSVTVPTVGRTRHRYATPGASTLASTAAAPLVTRSGHHLRRPLAGGLATHPGIPLTIHSGAVGPTAHWRLMARSEQHDARVRAENHGVLVTPETQTVSI